MVDDEDELLGEGLLEDLEEWDKMFDSLHLPETSDLPFAGAPADEDFQLEGQATDADIDVGEGATVVRDPVFREASATSNRSSSGKPCGRATRRISRETPSMWR